MTTSGTIPAMFIDRLTGFGLFGVEGQYNEAACLAGDGSVLSPIEVGASATRSMSPRSSTAGATCTCMPMAKASCRNSTPMPFLKPTILSDADRLR